MYLLNLSLMQFVAVFGTISAISVALYLLDRSRRKLVVSTLRFWVAAICSAVNMAGSFGEREGTGFCLVMLQCNMTLFYGSGPAFQEKYAALRQSRVTLLGGSRPEPQQMRDHALRLRGPA